MFSKILFSERIFIMAIEYREERNQKIENQIQILISDAPYYVKDFARNMQSGKREITTQLSYLRDVINFIKYESSTLNEFKEKQISDFPISVFDSLRLQDLNEYRSYLKKAQQLSNSSIKKIFASLSSFYSYLNMMQLTSNNPMQFFEAPAINKKKIIKLDSDLSTQLLQGILKNDKLVLNPGENSSVIDIDDATKARRERLVLRNYAITCLFLGSGLRVSELVGLDLDDINFRNSSITVIAKGGDETEVYFGDDVAKALRDYINGVPTSQEMLSEYQNAGFIAEWVQNHKNDGNFDEKFMEEFPYADKTMLLNVTKCRYSMLRQGRAGLNPQKGCNAVFITTRGTRMSVRSVELMIKEMVQTYLPEYDDKDKFSPHKLRATCATRILTQTGDIQLASTQLNHKGIAVTAAFYAELQKEQQKERVKKLDMNEW
jgi:site-specific recombinase XerD